VSALIQAAISGITFSSTSADWRKRIFLKADYELFIERWNFFRPEETATDDLDYYPRA
jgi:hypothetical protein